MPPYNNIHFKTKNFKMTQVTTTSQAPAAPVAINYFDVQQYDMLQRISKGFIYSELVPEMYRVSEKNTPEKAIANVMIALSISQRINADPLMVMQNLVVIYGRPSWSSKFLIGTVNTCGRFEQIKYRLENKGKIGKIQVVQYQYVSGRKQAVNVEFDGTKIDNISCVAYTKEKSTGEVLESSEVSILMAIQEGWYTKDGSKWKTMPEKMLRYRAASFWTNENAPEISLGMQTQEESEDIYEITPHVDMTERVKTEITENANKKTVEFDQPAEGAASAMQPNKEFDNKEPEKTQENPRVDPNKPESNPGTPQGTIDGPGFQ